MKGTPRLAAILASGLVVIACFLGLASEANAIDFAINDQFYLGHIVPDGGSEATQAEQINFLVGLTPGDTGISDNATPQANIYDRSTNILCFGSCPTATDVGSIKDDTGGNDGNLGTGFTYLKAKYGDSADVWYVAGLTGDFTLPESTDEGGLSHWVLFNPGGTVVPEPGTLVLAGTMLVGIGVWSRKKLLGALTRAA
jgi:hypothetical protein